MSDIFPGLAQIKELARHRCGDIDLVYRHDGATGQVEFSLVPTALAGRVTPRRGNMNDDFQVRRLTWTHAPWLLDPLVHVKLLGSPNPGSLTAGGSLRGAPDTEQLVLEGQRVESEGAARVVITRLKAKDGRYACEHRASWVEGEPGLRITSTFENLSSEPLELEMLSSFSLGDLTPFDAAEATDRLVVHRHRSWWSSEARRESRTLEEMHLERTWGTGPTRFEKFGQIGTLPVRQFFPFLAVEDRVAGVVWAAQLAWPGSWQMELSRRGDSLAISGGLADRLSGHWVKRVAPGGSFTTPEALLTVAAGSVDHACQRLTRLHARARRAQPAIERGLPVVFNDWCTYWGLPTHDAVVAMADKLRGSGVTYFVIDAGWYVDPGKPWGTMHGDWEVSRERFPQGIRATADAIRARGLVPGLWFEFENCGENSACKDETTLLLKQDGVVVNSGGRRFLDLRNPAAVERLGRRVIALLREGGFGYLKVDYNESTGFGVDGAESPGEGLRQHVEGVLAFFRRIRAELPDLVIENCSSGGHRLEPALMQTCAIGSFSDAHEGREVPVIGAELQFSILAEQNLVWSALRVDDDEARLRYSLASGLLGRMCVSGDLTALRPEQLAILREATAFYAEAAGIIAAGESVLHREHRSASWRDLRGWQASVRRADDGRSLLVVAHRFDERPGTPPVSVALPPGRWRVARAFGPGVALAPGGGALDMGLASAWTASAAILVAE
jgi:alpha-galactosidase